MTHAKSDNNVQPHPDAPDVEPDFKAKEDFISIASHQLRTPATGVKQYLGMVVEGFVGEVPPAQMALLRQAYQSNERQLRIINDLLKVAQVDSGTMKLRPSPSNVHTLLREVINELEGTLAGRGQTIQLKKRGKGVPIVEFDADAIRMVIENVIDNASKYSPEGSSILVEITQQPNSVSMSVHDQGVGIEHEYLPRLFEKFVRFDNMLSTKVGGSGLGLYWAKRIIDMHGGRIDYQPNQPAGSIFTIVLPKTLAQKSELSHITNGK